jgi:hypothetical protein
VTAAVLSRSLESGARYLAQRQRPDGHWEDFELPVGSSNAWVTAYVGLALARLGRSPAAEIAGARDAASRAAAWLDRHRPYDAGWGFNDRTGADADSTAHALLLLRAVGRRVRADDERWLADAWQPGGGFATYRRADGWGLAHPDVTPVAYRALSREQRQRLRPHVVVCVRSSRDADGSWPAYWWRTRHYSTFLNGRLARDLGATPSSPGAVVSHEDSRAVHSVFDLVFVTAATALRAGAASVVNGLLSLLVERQRPDGGWPGARNLRVMRHDAPAPWTHPAGELYADTHGLITTASAVRLIATMVRPWT